MNHNRYDATPSDYISVIVTDYGMVSVIYKSFLSLVEIFASRCILASNPRNTQVQCIWPVFIVYTFFIICSSFLGGLNVLDAESCLKLLALANLTHYIACATDPSHKCACHCARVSEGVLVDIEFSHVFAEVKLLT